jgi:serine/threonine-protein kinase
MGRGGGTTVFEARQERTGRRVVVRVPEPSLHPDEDFRRRFSEGLRTLAARSHPDIVEVLDSGEFEGTPFLVLPFLTGGSLADRLASEAGRPDRPDPARLLSWLRPVARGLDSIHACGVVHRDVRPANILFDRTGNVFLSDFAMTAARGPLAGSPPEAGACSGPSARLAPEVPAGGGFSPASDQYALAMVVQEAVAGSPLSGEVRTLPPAAAAAIRRALHGRPEERYPTCTAFADALAAALGEEAEGEAAARPSASATTPPPPPEPGPGRGARRGPRPLLLLAAAGLVGAMVLSALLVFRREPPPPPVPEATERTGRVIADFLDRDLPGIEAIYREAKAQGHAGLARRIARYVLDNMDRNSAFANEEFGRRNRAGIFARIPEDERLEACPNLELVQLRALRETSEELWVDAAEFAEVEKALDATLAHLARLESDPVLVNALRIVKGLDLPKGCRTRIAPEQTPPYLMVAEDPARELPAVRREADRRIGQNRDLLRQVYERFVAEFGSAIAPGLVSTPETPWPQVLVVFTFFGEESFWKYQRDIGMPLPDGVKAGYDPKSRWLVRFEDLERPVNRDGFHDNKAIHEGVHQLIHALTKATVEKALGETVPWSDPRLHSRLHWFQEGMAELFGSSRKKEGGGVEMLVPYLSRLQEWKMTRNQKRSEWTFEELLDVAGGADLQRKAARKGLADAGRLSSLFYAQAWAWCWFLHTSKDGRYRPLLVEQLRQELKGNSGPAVFYEQVWKTKPGSPEWTAMKEEFESFVRQLWVEFRIK